jgi:DNA-binding MarR family transcriptional regulator
MRRASRAVCHLYDLVLAPTRLKSSQFIMLHAIAQAGQIAHCDLATLLAASEETLSRRLAAARRVQWVEMWVDKRRRHVYRLTEAGAGVLAAAMPYWERAQERLRREMGDPGWATLAPTAETVVQAAMRAENAPARNTSPATLPPLEIAAQSIASVNGVADNAARIQ